MDLQYARRRHKLTKRMPGVCGGGGGGDVVTTACTENRRRPAHFSAADRFTLQLTAVIKAELN